MPSTQDVLDDDVEEATGENHEGEGGTTKADEEVEAEVEVEEQEGEPNKEEVETEKVEKLKPERDDFEEEEESEDDSFDDDKDEFVLVKLDGVRREVQCPICLGIIRKTRTVMECLHRFCRECIDKSMRLGNNECPACRTHCASRRSLRDDPNYDALISALYPDIDKFEQQELAFNEEEKNRNKIIQETIAETFRRQSECLGKRAGLKTNPIRRSRKRFKRDAGPAGTGTGSGSSEEDQQENNTNNEENNNNNTNTNLNGPQSPEREAGPPVPPPTRKRGRPRSNPHADVTNNTNNNNVINNTNTNSNGNLRDNLNVSPIRAWGKNGVRTRHLNNNNNGNNNNSNGNNSRVSRGNRLAKLVEYLRGLDGNSSNNEGYFVNVSLVKMDGNESFYVRCKSSVSLDQLCKVVAQRVNCEVGKVEIFVKEINVRFNGEISLQEIVSSFSLNPDHLEMVYVVKGGNGEGGFV